MKLDYKDIGVGATKELNLRVSVATLVRVLFESPENDNMMLVLERTATLKKLKGQTEVIVKAKPFGGGVRIINPHGLEKLIGPFHYDSERSREEKDFRLFIRPESWEKIKNICRENLEEKWGRILDISPDRELSEEFEDSLKVSITPSQYFLKPPGILIEDQPEKTNSVRAYGFPTVRIYYIFEAWLRNKEIIRMILNNSLQISDEDLKKMALVNASSGGKGRANAVLVTEIENLIKLYRTIPVKNLRRIQQIGAHKFDGNVYAILK